MTQKKHVYVERSEHIIKLKTFAYSLKKVLCKDFVHVRWWSEMFSASTIDENTIGKIFPPNWYIFHKHPCEIASHSIK